MSPLKDGSLTVTLNLKTEAEIRAFVRTGANVYCVNLAESGSFCSCPDATHRHTICKHIAAVCIVALQHTEPAQDPIHLWLADSKAALCGDARSSQIWYRPADCAANWQDLLCPACFRTWKRPAPLSRDEHFYQGQDDQEAAA
jgi:hypothetical protein